MSPFAYRPNRTRLLQGLTVAAALLMLATFALAFFYAPTEIKQGNVQRIFYMHVGSFSAAFIAFFVTVGAGVMYLRTRNPRWDKLALAGIQVGLPLATITLVTGAIWARPTWNAFWVRDARLDAMLVMWAIYAAYLILRGAIPSPEQRARFSAVYGILAIVSVIWVTGVIRLKPTETLHPIVIAPEVSAVVVSEPTAKGEFTTTDPRISATLGFSSIAWTVLSCAMMWHLVRVGNLSERVQLLKLKLAESE